MNGWLWSVFLTAALAWLGDCCFLNSCPYRRIGRSNQPGRPSPTITIETCGLCARDNSGVCVAEGVCCTGRQCVEDRACLNLHECPLPLCVIEGGPGVCATSSLCCAEKYCQRNLQCMVTAARKIRL